MPKHFAPQLAGPAGLDGSPVILARVCHAGAGDGPAAVRPLREIAPPLLDLVGPTPYPALLDGSPGRGMRPAVQTMFLDHLDTSTAGVILDQLGRARSRLRLVQFRVIGGAVARIGPDETAYAHRASPILVTVVHGEHADQQWADRWAREVVDALSQGENAAYVNFLGPDDADRVERAYPAPTLARLRGIKAAYDPANVFRNNVNIAPAGRSEDG